MVGHTGVIIPFVGTNFIYLFCNALHLYLFQNNSCLCAFENTAELFPNNQTQRALCMEACGNESLQMACGRKVKI